MALPETWDTLQLQTHADGVLQVTLNRSDVGNAINTRMGQELLDLWLSLTDDPQGLRCVMLTGAGPKIFCAGGDLKERNGMTRAQWTHQHEIFERQYWALVDLPLPVIAVVNGHAYGGGLELVLCCDFIYASTRARFALPEVTLGIMPGMGGTQNLPRALGERRAKELIMTGQSFTAEQALTWGLVNQVIEPEQLHNEALRTAQTLARNAPLSVRQIKKSIRYGGQMELRTAYRFEVEAYNQLVDTEDRREGVLAFNEKRAPQFKGR
ncbi:enoyl-CoA hydratase [Limnohabitans sp. 2KL-17]|uniref:enoyl-CoA hydratase/isomerase family protein n=1 Tax=Limnohabitans sp. 2KL-17 TaxID=1100704 RepID=UPI000D3AD7DF|nr:enoyl-CoA hydratase-related protein [Limnohabitans sp. 2KL-17]PUE53838.1 enoyl-CoA hydratase [Limnohabitans sp. 2KL-17]